MFYLNPLFMLQNPAVLKRFLQKLYDEQKTGRVKALKSLGVMVANCVSASVVITTTHPDYFAQLPAMVDLMNRSQNHHGTELTSNTVKMLATVSTVFVTGVNERAIKTNLGKTTHQPLGWTHKLVRDTLSSVLCVGNNPPLPAAHEGPCPMRQLTSDEYGQIVQAFMAHEIYNGAPMCMQDLIGQLHDFDPRFVTSSVDVAFAAGNQLLPHMLEKCWGSFEVKGTLRPNLAEPPESLNGDALGSDNIFAELAKIAELPGQPQSPAGFSGVLASQLQRLTQSLPDESTLQSYAGWLMPPLTADSAGNGALVMAPFAASSASSALVPAAPASWQFLPDAAAGSVLLAQVPEHLLETEAFWAGYDLQSARAESERGSALLTPRRQAGARAASSRQSSPASVPASAVSRHTATPNPDPIPEPNPSPNNPSPNYKLWGQVAKITMAILAGGCYRRGGCLIHRGCRIRGGAGEQQQRREPARPHRREARGRRQQRGRGRRRRRRGRRRRRRGRRRRRRGRRHVARRRAGARHR